VTDDESGESTEPMEEVPLKELSESGLERSRELIPDRDEGKHRPTERNDLLLVQKMK